MAKKNLVLNPTLGACYPTGGSLYVQRRLQLERFQSLYWLGMCELLRKTQRFRKSAFLFPILVEE
jgi:hypothetical protein